MRILLHRVNKTQIEWVISRAWRWARLPLLLGCLVNFLLRLINQLVKIELIRLNFACSVRELIWNLQTILAVVGHSSSPSVVGGSAELFHWLKRIVTCFPKSLLHAFYDSWLGGLLDRNVALNVRLSIVRVEVVQEL